MEFVQPIRAKKQIDAMKKILKATSVRDFCLFTLGINCGLRISDLLNLLVSDVIDEEGKVLDRISTREQKTGKIKNFPISEIAAKAIKEYLVERGSYNQHEPLFLSRKSTNGLASLQRWQAYTVINAAARAIGIKDKIGTHTLRKTFGYHAFQQSVDITIIQKLLNHSSPRVTLAYIGITQDELDNVVLNLNL